LLPTLAATNHQYVAIQAIDQGKIIYLNSGDWIEIGTLWNM
jgi:hypothetical protein